MPSQSVRSTIGTVANDIVLDHPEPGVKRAISRWHFELRRTVGGYRLRQKSAQATHVNGRLVIEQKDVPIHPGTVVKVAHRLQLRFTGARHDPLTVAKTAVGYPSEMTEAISRLPRPTDNDD